MSGIVTSMTTNDFQISWNTPTYEGFEGRFINNVLRSFPLEMFSVAGDLQKLFKVIADDTIR